MTIRLAADAYGARTAAIQAVISDAEEMPLFVEGDPAGAASETRALVEDHLQQMSERGLVLPAVEGCRMIEGPVGLLAKEWNVRGQQWRDAIAGVIEDMRHRYDQEPLRNRLVPPIWPYSHLSNVFGIAIVATEEMYRRCQVVSRDTEEVKQAWKVVVAVEKWVEALMLAELFGDIAPRNPLRPIFALCRRGTLPLGWHEGTFWLYRFGSRV